MALGGFRMSETVRLVPKYGISSAVQQFITYWLSNNLNTVASVPDDGTKDATFSRGGSKAYIPTWDSTSGLVVTEVPADAVAVEGMRYDTGVFYNDDGSGNKLTPTKSYTDADGNTQEVFVEVDARANNESIASEGYRRTPTASPHNYYYQNQTLASPATTSLVAPLRNSDGQYYEERIKNGGFDVDAEWNVDPGITIAGGNAVWAASTGILNQDINQVTSGGSYIATIVVDSYTGGDLQARVGGGSLVEFNIATTTSYSVTLTAGSLNTLFEVAAAGGSTTLEISAVSLIEVDANGNPTNVLDGGRRQSETNITTYSEDLTNWTTQFATISANATTAPDGNATADKVVETAVTNVHRAYIPAATIVSGTLYTGSVFLKAAERTWGFVLVNDGTTLFSTYINLETGELGTTSGTAIFKSVPADNGFWRVSITFTATNTTGYIYAYPATGDGVNNYAGDITKGIYAWGAMLHEGMGPSERPAFEYIPTTTGSVQATPNVSTSVLWSYSGRYTNMAGTQNHLTGVLHEPAATNYLLNSGTPANQTTGSLGTGTYTLWVDDDATGSVSATDNTATSDAAGQSASAGTPLTFTVSSAGTVDIAVTGDVTYSQLENSAVPTSYIPTTTGSVQRNASSETSTAVFSKQFIRCRASSGLYSGEVLLSDGTNVLTWGGTDLTFTDGTTTLTAASVALASGDDIVIDTVDGKLYVNGVLKDTDAALSPTWGALTVIGNIVDLMESSSLDPTDQTWKTL